MFLKYLLICISLSYGETFSFNSKLLKYKLSYSQEKINYKASDVDLNIKNQDCISLSYQNLISIIDLQLKKLEKNQNKRDDFVRIGKDSFYLDNPVFYKNLFQNIKDLKIEESISCTK